MILLASVRHTVLDFQNSMKTGPAATENLGNADSAFLANILSDDLSRDCYNCRQQESARDGSISQSRAIYCFGDLCVCVCVGGGGFWSHRKIDQLYGRK